MADAELFQPRRFRTAAQHYLAGRPAYAPRLIRHVARFTGLAPEHRVLDLGCGPGMLAGAFAPLAGEVIAMDPEPEMLRIAEAEFGGSRAHPLRARQLVRSVAGARAVSPGDDGTFVPVDGPGRRRCAGWMR